MAQFTLFLFESRFSAIILTITTHSRLQTTTSINYGTGKETDFHFMERWTRKDYANQYANGGNYSQQ